MPDPTDDDDALPWIADLAGASQARLGTRIQSLWSGYGEVRRVDLTGANVDSVVMKRVVPPTSASHPRGWSGQRSHDRKLRSYEVELAFWRLGAPRCDEACRVPRCLAARRVTDGFQFVLEDLDASGFSARRHHLSAAAIAPCLAWLAAFHATFMGTPPANLWPVGTYWHLDTRPDELAAIADPMLARAAPHFDRALNEACHQTLVHGDAKVANFCFSPSGDRVAAVDFQYAGGGVGVKDVAYLFSSCFDGADCEQHAASCLDLYFTFLRRELGQRHPAIDAAAVEHEWRTLYPIAWADFVRFLAGWAPEHHKLHAYSQHMVELALAR